MGQQWNGHTLDGNLEDFRNHLRQASDVVVHLYAQLNQIRITTAKTQKEIVSMFDEPLPLEAQPMEELLNEVEKKIFENSTLYSSPRFFGYINSSGNQASILAELLASAVNQICALWHFSPAASEVEGRVIRWIAEFIGYSPTAGGCLLSGGSAGNLVALAVARSQKAGFDTGSLGMRAAAPLTVYMSQEGHASVDKAMMLLGLGRNQLRKIPVRDDFTVDLNALEKMIVEDRNNGSLPICVVGMGGTTNTGAVDPLNELADICRAQGLWFHVDAAYGGPAACTKVVGELFQGLDRADSVSVNPHKWLYVPPEVGCILVREPVALQHTFEVAADYFKDEGEANPNAPIDFKDFGPQLTRSFKALKVWMTFKAYGVSKLRAAIESNIETMRYLARRIDESEDFIRLAPVPLSVVCFQYRPAGIPKHEDERYLNELNSRLIDAVEKDGRVFLSGTYIHGKRVLRACSVNHRLRREHVDFLFKVVSEIGSSLMGKTNSFEVNSEDSAS
jgi:aromatic-L-amino-acid decarboxylase